MDSPTEIECAAAKRLVGRYCTAHGLVAGAKYNGKRCFVAKVDPTNAVRVCVIFVDFLSHPNFVSLKPQNLKDAECGVEVRPSKLPNGGLGVSALRDFKIGETVFMEKPFMAVPDKFAGTYDSTTPASYTAMINQHGSPPVVEVLESLTVGAVATPERRLAARGGDWALRMGNNALSAGPPPHSDLNLLYPILCRLNHACLWTSQHNVAWCVNEERTLTATRDIQAGEELLTDYVGSHLFPKRRKESLAAYGIPSCDESSLHAASAPCRVCCHPDAPRLFAGFNSSTEALDVFAESFTEAAPTKAQVLCRVEEGIALAARCIERCDAITSTLFSPASSDEYPLRSCLAEEKRNEYIPLLAMLFDEAVTNQLRSPAKLLYAMLMELFDAQIASMPRMYGNTSHPQFIEKDRILMNKQNTMKRLKHLNA